MPKTPNRATELMLLGLLALLWGSSYLFIKVAVATIPPLTLMAARVTLAAAVLVLVARLQRRSFPADRATWRALFVQSVLNSTAAWALLAWGAQFVDSGLAGVLNSTSPIFVFFITLLWTRHETVNALKLVGALLGLAGVVLIIGVEALAGLGREVAAQLAVLASAGLYAGAAIYGKRFTHLPPVITAAGATLWASAVLVPASLLVERPWTLEPAPVSVLALLALSLFSTAGALLLYFRLIGSLGSMGVASQAYLRAGVSVLLGAIVLGERLDWTVGLGLAAVILGVAAINTRLGRS
ncbi:MAG: EamA family transporter [Hyphomicrobiales bacterium]|nr:EamA family transporter [Hyphomicrobiales bacterium]